MNSVQPATETVAKKTPATVSSGDFFASLSMPPVELIFRGLRVVVILFGLIFLLTLLRGAFQYIVASGRDDTVSECRRKIFVGAVGVLVMFFLYIFATMSLFQLLSVE